MRRAHQKLALVIKKDAWLPIEFHWHMSALVQKRTNAAGMTDGERGERSVALIGKIESHSVSAIDEVAGGADSQGRSILTQKLDVRHAQGSGAALPGSFSPNSANKVCRSAATSSTSATAGSLSKSIRS